MSSFISDVYDDSINEKILHRNSPWTNKLNSYTK